MIRLQRNLLCGPLTDPKPPGSHRFPESKTAQPAALSDVMVLLIFEGQ